MWVISQIENLFISSELNLDENAFQWLNIYIEHFKKQPFIFVKVR